MTVPGSYLDRPQAKLQGGATPTKAGVLLRQGDRVENPEAQEPAPRTGSTDQHSMGWPAWPRLEETGGRIFGAHGKPETARGTQSHRGCRSSPQGAAAPGLKQHRLCAWAIKSHPTQLDRNLKKDGAVSK